MVLVHLYDRPDVSISEHGDHHDAIVPVLESIRALKLEVWQANFIVTEKSVRLDRYAPLNLTQKSHPSNRKNSRLLGRLF